LDEEGTHGAWDLNFFLGKPNENCHLERGFVVHHGIVSTDKK
jgi:hypothetical protein